MHSQSYLVWNIVQLIKNNRISLYWFCWNITTIAGSIGL